MGAKGEFVKECSCSEEAVKKSDLLVEAERWGLLTKAKFEEKCQTCKYCGDCSPTCEDLTGFKCI